MFSESPRQAEVESFMSRYAQDHFTHLRGGGSWVGMDSRATSAIYGEVPPSFSRNEAAPVS